MEELRDVLKLLKDEIDRSVEFIDMNSLGTKILELESETMSDILWDNPARARKITSELSQLIKKRDLWMGLKNEVADLIGLLEIYFTEDTHTEKERAQFHADVKDFEKRFHIASKELFMSGDYDSYNAIVSIYSGAGGVDAQDWVAMLLRMYLRYCERRGYKVEMMNRNDGDAGGVKHVSFLVQGAYAYGYLKEEKGVHRLVRLSPFNAGNTRETSFGLVEVVPELVDETDSVKIADKDLRIDVYCASGKGGQNVNKVASAVRITHIPTGIAVACQNERSQLQNRERAMAQLRGKLVAMQKEMRVEKIEDLKGDLGKNEWGHQIRSYVLHPYKMVKDHRTDWETSQVEKVLDGELDDAIEAGLSAK